MLSPSLFVWSIEGNPYLQSTRGGTGASPVHKTPTFQGSSRKSRSNADGRIATRTLGPRTTVVFGFIEPGKVDQNSDPIQLYHAERRATCTLRQSRSDVFHPG